MLKNLSPRNFLAKYVKNKFVNQVDANIAIVFYEVITVMAFTYSVFITNRVNNPK